MLRFRKLIITILIFELTNGSVVFALDQQSSSFRIDSSALAPSGFDVSSSNYQITGALGTIVGLSNSSSYLVRHGLRITQTITPAPTPTPSTPIQTGGGAFVSEVLSPTTGVEVIGRAYPNSVVSFVKDVEISAKTIAGPDGYFHIKTNGLTAGNYHFLVYTEDAHGVKSASFSFPATVTNGSTVIVSGIYLAPTISADKAEVRQGDNIAFFGQSAPSSTVRIGIHSDRFITVQTVADNRGVYLYSYDTSPLEKGGHEAKAKSMTLVELTDYGSPIAFYVGNVSRATGACKRADINCDGKISLIDFSIAMYWYKKTLTEPLLIIERSRLNGDGKIDLVDFSILAYSWSG